MIQNADSSSPLPPRAALWPQDHQPTPFQREVIRAVRRLLPGDLVTYGGLAEEIGRPGGGQAVANVLRRAPGLPWWRVVPAGGRLYCTHAPLQAPLLEAEGHVVDDDRRVHRAARQLGRSGRGTRRDPRAEGRGESPAVALRSNRSGRVAPSGGG